MNRRVALSLAGIAVVGVVAPTRADATTDANKAAARGYIADVWDKANVAAIDTYVSADVAPSNATDAPGLDAFKARVQTAIRASSQTVKNIHYTIEDIVADADRVFIRGSITGASSNGKKINAPYFDELQFKGGLIIAEWSLVDRSALLGF